VARPSRIILTGFSGTGKTAAAPLAAQRLGWGVVDTDSLVEKAAGKAILDIFRDEGEARFRDLEAKALAEACSQQNVVVSTGGGVVLRAENRRRMADGGIVVCLESRPETILARLSERSEAEPLDRPLLATSDPLARIRELKAARQHLYALCDWAIHTDALSPEAVADEIVRAWESMGGAATREASRLEAMAAAGAPSPPATLHAIPDGAACVVRASGGHYPVFVEWDALSNLGGRMREAGLTAQAYVISDETVFEEYGGRVEAAISGADISVASFTIPPGEASKSPETAAAVYDWLLGHRVERGQTIVALGGGVVTDLGGYVAATCLRGLPLVQAPTSLLAMVDAAVGGKVGVNHPRAKNAIGAFCQPQFVLADVSTLRSLPERELTGWAEAIKHALILDAGLLGFFEERADSLLALAPEATTEAIRRSVSIKAVVVSEDEREETGQRTLLNYGHTVGHAIEAATEYGRYRHGEADAIGMTAAAAISRRMGLLSKEAAERQRAALERFRLPTRAEGVERKAVLEAMKLDKKVRGKTIRWVLLEGIGRAVLRDDVPEEAVEAALDEVLA
jgi:shikimate kinase/3-dehydroquinate synthase